LHERPAQVGIAAAGDASQAHLAAGRVSEWREAEPRGELPSAAELAGIDDGGGDCTCRERTNTAQAGDPDRARIVASLLRNRPVALREMGLELAQMLQLAHRALPQCRRQRLIGQPGHRA